MIRIVVIRGLTKHANTMTGLVAPFAALIELPGGTQGWLPTRRSVTCAMSNWLLLKRPLLPSTLRADAPAAKLPTGALPITEPMFSVLTLCAPPLIWLTSPRFTREAALSRLVLRGPKLIRVNRPRSSCFRFYGANQCGQRYGFEIYLALKAPAGGVDERVSGGRVC